MPRSFARPPGTPASDEASAPSRCVRWVGTSATSVSCRAVTNAAAVKGWPEPSCSARSAASQLTAQTRLWVIGSGSAAACTAWAVMSYHWSPGPGREPDGLASAAADGTAGSRTSSAARASVAPRRRTRGTCTEASMSDLDLLQLASAGLGTEQIAADRQEPQP